MNLGKLFDEGKFVVTSEVSPPKGVDVEEMLEEVELLRSRVDAFNVTDQQSAVMRLGSLAVCRLLKEGGMEAIFQLTCRDRNRIALQSDLLSAYVLGIENILCLTGDYVTLGDHPHARPVFDLDAVSLLWTVRRLQKGYDLSDKELQGAPHFYVGAVVNPGANPLEMQLIKMGKKIEAGAQFFQTQAVFDPQKFEAFMKRVEGFGVPVMVGIIPLKSAGMARFMNRNISGIQVPEELIEAMEKASDRVQTSIEIAGRLIRETKDMCQGVHIMALGWEKHIPAILDEAGL